MDAALKPNPPRRWLLFALAALACVALAGCIAEREDEDVVCASPSWEYIQANIFAGRGYCTNCHTGSGAGPSNLSLDSDQYDRVVTNGLLAGTTGVSLAIIEPGSKAQSFLYLKISTADSVLVNAGEGNRMPKGADPLSTADTSLIGTWIDQGALPTSTECVP